jgi:hypothetical protein
LIGLAVLWPVKWIESHLSRQCRCKISVTVSAEGPTEANIRRRLQAAGMFIRSSRILLAEHALHELIVEASHFRVPSSTETPAFIYAIAEEKGVVKIDFQTLR